jgi:sulfopyruvate decarboxylase subunit alpha
MIEIYTPNPAGGPSASALLAALQSEKVTHCVTVPDFVQFALHQRIMAEDSGLANVLACTEDQALTTATGIYIGGGKPVVMVQNQGFFKCMNTLRATCMDSAVPMVFLVGQFGREAENFGQPARQSSRSMVRIIEPLLEALGLRFWNIDEEADIPRVADAFTHAASAKTAGVLLIGRHVAWN